MNVKELKSISRNDIVKFNRTDETYIIHNVQPSNKAVVAIRSVIICEYNRPFWSIIKPKHDKKPSAVGTVVMLNFAGKAYKATLTEEIFV